MNQKTLVVAMATAVLVLGAVALYRTGEQTIGGEHGAAEANSSYPRGPHRGRLFSDGDFQFEVTIYETGVEPQFRFYGYRNEQPIAPAELKATATVTRLGASQQIQFKPEADYLLGDQVVYEPHSFDVTVDVEYGGKRYQWSYPSYEGRLQMAAASLASGEIGIEAAGPQTIATTLKLPGEVKIKHDRRVQIVPRVGGVAVAVPKGLGDNVNKGDILLVLESRELAQLKSNWLTARERLELASANYQRENNLWQQKITAEQDYLQAQKNQREAEIVLKSAYQSLQALGLSSRELEVGDNGSLSRFEVRAPFSGVLISRQVAIGSSVVPEVPVFALADISAMEVRVAVYPQHLDQIKVGQHVLVRALGAELSAEGKISFVGTQVGESSRAATAHVVFANPDGRWREGLFVEAEIVLEEATVPVAVKAEAIQTFRDWQVVFAQFGEQYEIRPVTLGRSNAEWVEVVEGIPAGQLYVAHNAFVMKAELGKSGATHDH